MMKAMNEMSVSFLSVSANESFARAVVAAFASQGPYHDQLADLKTAVSEAVTNAIVHGYRETLGMVYITAKLYETGKISVKIRDKGVGIEDVEKAMEPLFTTGGEERAGLGFAVMQSFCDKVTVRSKVGKGTAVTLEKNLLRRARGHE